MLMLMLMLTSVRPCLCAVVLQEALDVPCYPAWLAATGRSLLTIGRLLQASQPWLQYQMRLRRSGGSRGGSAGLTMVLALHASAFGWLHEQLEELQSHPTAAPAAQLPPGMLEELWQLADSLAPRFDHLLKLCDTGSMLGAVNPAAEAAVFAAHLQGCAEGWLPEGLQKLGAKVWAAWPQKYACNDDLCSNMGCLAEHSCGRSQCSGCQVSLGNDDQGGYNNKGFHQQQ